MTKKKIAQSKRTTKAAPVDAEIRRAAARAGIARVSAAAEVRRLEDELGRIRDRAIRSAVSIGDSFVMAAALDSAILSAVAVFAADESGRLKGDLIESIRQAGRARLLVRTALDARGAAL